MIEKAINGFVDYEMFRYAIKKAEETNFSNLELLNQAKAIFDKYTLERERIQQIIIIFEDQNILRALEDGELDFGSEMFGKQRASTRASLMG